MKKILFTSAILLGACSLTFAQTQRGRWQVGTQVGNVTYVDNGVGESKRFAGSISPSAGYFIAKNLLLGVGLPLSLSTSRSQGSGAVYGGSEAKSTVTGVGLAPFVQYYIGDAKLKPFVGLAYSYVWSSAHYQSFSGVKSSASGHNTLVAPNVGVAYFVTPNIALNATLSYNIQSQNSSFLVASPNSIETGPAVTSKSAGMGIGFQLFFGK